jgi:hypothetical protein
VSGLSGDGEGLMTTKERLDLIFVLSIFVVFVFIVGLMGVAIGLLCKWLGLQ